MNFKDTRTNKIIKLEELKESYTQAKKNSKSKYINFQDYLMECINKYKIIEIN